MYSNVVPSELSSFPTVSLLSPTKIIALPRLTSAITPALSKTAIYLFPEYLTSPQFPGGSKTRKLEYVLPQAIDQGCDTLITVGGIQSNHARQVAAAAAKLGLKCVLVLSERVEVMRTKRVYNTLGNVQIERLMGAEIRVLRDGEQEDVAVHETCAQVERKGGKACFIPSGASMDERGGLGYAAWVFEMLKLEQEANLSGSKIFDWIFVACNSGSTLGGIVAGLKLLEKFNNLDLNNLEGHKRRVVGVDTAIREDHETRKLVMDIARTTGQLLRLTEEEMPRSEDVPVDGRWAAEGYGVLDEATRRIVNEVATLEGVITDPVYTGKAMRALVEAVSGGEVSGNVLFLHTGGQIAISAYLGISEN